MHTDAIWFRAFLTLHVAAGALSFLLAPLVLATVKGGRTHRRWGMVYLWSMGVVAATALIMAITLPVLFLALVAVLSFDLAFTGYRILKLKDLARGGAAHPIDWMAAGVTFAACACLVGFGLLRPRWVQGMGTVSIVLGTLGMRGAVSDMTLFIRTPRRRLFWLDTHLQKFIGSYIAAWTAFSAVTLSQVFQHAGLFVWLWPTAVGVPGIVLATGYYRRKFAPKAWDGRAMA